MGSTLTTFDGLLKERYYDSSIVEKLIYPDNVLLGMLEKKGDTGMQGDVIPVPIVYGFPQGIGKVFSTAQSRATNLKNSKWQITAGEYYGVVHIGDKVLMASRTNAGAFLENKQIEIDGLYEQMAENMSLYLWGNGGNALGRRQSLSNNTVTLTNSVDAANFEVGMSIVASAGDGSSSGHSLLTNSDTVTVEAVNRATGEIELSDATDIGSFADGDFLFRESDFKGATSEDIVVGIQAFITATDSPPALWGVSAATRATDVQRWSGCRVPEAYNTGSIEERLKRCVAWMVGRFKAKAPDVVFLHPEDFQKLDTLMTSRGQRDLERSSTTFGYEGIRMASPGGKLTIYADRHCPLGHAFFMRMKNHWITSMGELFHPQNKDGFQMLRRATTTDYEVRVISYPAYCNNGPLFFGRVNLY